MILRLLTSNMAKGAHRYDEKIVHNIRIDIVCPLSYL